MLKQKVRWGLTRLMPTEFVLIFYLLLTGILILIHISSLTNPLVHLGIRLAIIVFGTLLIYWQQTHHTNPFLYFVRLFFPFILLGYLYNETGYLNHLIIHHHIDTLVSNFEFRLFGFQPSLRFNILFPSNIFAELMYFAYFAYYLLIVGIPLHIFFKSEKKIAQKTVFIIINSFLIYYLIFICFPVAGPQFFYAKLDPLPPGYLFGRLIRFIQQMGEAPTAAFPSSHVSIALMLLWLSSKYAKPLFPVALPVVLLLIFSTVYIRAHYLVDVLAAFITTPVIYIIALFIYKKLQLYTKNT